MPTVQEVRDAPSVFRGLGLSQEPVASTRVVKMTGLPLTGHCSLCNDQWGHHSSVFRGDGPFARSRKLRSEPYLFDVDSGGDSRFFDGLPLGEEVTLTLATDLYADSPLLGVMSRVNRRWYSYFHFGAYRGAVKLPWLSMMVRFLLRPRAWFRSLLQYVVASTLTRGTELVRLHGSGAFGEGSADAYDDGHALLQGEIPHPYVSIHVRHGIKAVEQKLVEVDRYFDVMRTKYPHIRRVFMSTESAWTIAHAVERYPELEIYSLDYHRVASMRVSQMEAVDYPYEFVFSFANLYLAAAADGFVGTLTSNWCTIIQYLEHTRGDGGVPYHSVDGRGSAFTQCF
jgi:hypothetical protein